MITCIPLNIRINTSRRIKWARHETRTGEINAYDILVEMPVIMEHSEELGVDGSC
jgi:hypothetical protein